MSEFTPIFAIYLAIILHFTVYKGFKYDQYKRDKNPNYRKNHSVGIINGKAAAIIPILINDNSQDHKIRKMIKQYNALVKLFWVSVFLFIVAYIIVE